MKIFEMASQVDARDAARAYGMDVRERGLSLCPFHDDHEPSLKLDRRFYCFGCGACGDSVDFVSMYLGIPKKDAARKIIADFGLDGTEYKVRKMVSERERKQRRDDKVFRALSRTKFGLKRIMDENPPDREKMIASPQFFRAIGDIGEVEYLIELYSTMDDAERDRMADLIMKDIEAIDHRNFR